MYIITITYYYGFYFEGVFVWFGGFGVWVVGKCLFKLVTGRSAAWPEGPTSWPS